MAHILITGAQGQVGQSLLALQQEYAEFSFTAIDRQGLDITDNKRVQAFFAGQHFDYCINTAAYTAVDRAETEPEAAQAVNVQGVANLARACMNTGTQLIHLSSDYVYHNTCNRPLRENDPTTPRGVYAQSKLAGEEAALQLAPSSIILRTSWVYSPFGHNFLKTMLRLSGERPELRIVYDQVGTPTYAPDLANAILQGIREKHVATQSGVFNYANEGVTSWYDFAREIFRLRKIDCRVMPILSADYPTPAPRPTYSLLDKHHFKTTFQQTIPHWHDGLERCLAVLFEK